jgi:hypothetical protein
MPYNDSVFTDMRLVGTSSIRIDLLQCINRTYKTAPTTEYTIFSNNLNAEITFQASIGFYPSL